jgi:hypothetical protein
MSDQPRPIEISQNGITTPLRDVFFSPASSHFDGIREWAIESSLSAGCDVPLQDGAAELSYNGQTFAVEVTVLEFEEDDVDEVGEDQAACHLLIDSGTIELAKLAELLELEP